MMKNIKFTLTTEEYAFLERHFENVRNGIHIDYFDGPVVDVLNRACEMTEKNEEAMDDYLNHESLDMVLWYLHHYQDQNGITRTFTDLFIN